MGESVGESYFCESFCGELVALGFCDALVEEWDLDVFEDGELWDEVECLKDEAELFATDFGEVFVVHVCDVSVVEKVLTG